MLYPILQEFIEETVSSFHTIDKERREILLNLSNNIIAKLKKKEPVDLLYICTHNSRRSHFGQIWGKVAPFYYGLDNVNTFSGGTEATAFNKNAIEAIKRWDLR